LAGELGRSKKVCSSMSKVQFYNRTTRQYLLPILRRIDVGDHMAKVGRIVGLKRQHVKYYVVKLERAGLVHRVKRSSIVDYELTDRGKNLLTSCEGVVFPGELYRLDKCQVAYEIRREGFLPVNFKRVEMQNWTALLGLEQGVKVRHTSKSWIVYVEVIRGKNAAEVYGLALNMANRVAVALCKKYGCLLGEGNFVAGELAVEDPIATLFGRYFAVRTDKRKIDHSWKVGELENLQKDAVIDYLQMPERLKRLESDYEDVKCDLKLINGKLQKIIDAFGIFDDSDTTGDSETPKPSDGSSGYVS